MSKRAPPPPPKFQHVLDKYVPAFITVRYKRGPKLTPADAVLRDQNMLVPKPHTVEALAVGLHECAHFIRKHFSIHHVAARGKMRKLLIELYTGNDKLTTAHEEFEAEQWTIATLRLEGIPVSKKTLASMKEYVKLCIREDRQKGAADAPARVKRFVKHFRKSKR